MHYAVRVADGDAREAQRFAPDVERFADDLAPRSRDRDPLAVEAGGPHLDGHHAPGVTHLAADGPARGLDLEWLGTDPAGVP